MRRKETGPQGTASQKSSPVELAARAAVEASLARPLTDSEWHEKRNRLIEFVQVLARWDGDQRNREQHLKIA